MKLHVLIHIFSFYRQERVDSEDTREKSNQARRPKKMAESSSSNNTEVELETTASRRSTRRTNKNV